MERRSLSWKRPASYSFIRASVVAATRNMNGVSAGLDVRFVRGVDPVPVIFDGRLKLGAASASPIRLLRPGTLILHTARASARARARITAALREVLGFGEREGVARERVHQVMVQMFPLSRAAE